MPQRQSCSIDAAVCPQSLYHDLAYVRCLRLSEGSDARRAATAT
jgi:hypothetical protein